MPFQPWTACKYIQSSFHTHTILIFIMQMFVSVRLAEYVHISHTDMPLTSLCSAHSHFKIVIQGVHPQTVAQMKWRPSSCWMVSLTFMLSSMKLNNRVQSGRSVFLYALQWIQNSSAHKAPGVCTLSFFTSPSLLFSLINSSFYVNSSTFCRKISVAGRRTRFSLHVFPEILLINEQTGNSVFCYTLIL